MKSDYLNMNRGERIGSIILIIVIILIVGVNIGFRLSNSESNVAITAAEIAHFNESIAVDSTIVNPAFRPKNKHNKNNKHKESVKRDPLKEPLPEL